MTWKLLFAKQRVLSLKLKTKTTIKGEKKKKEGKAFIYQNTGVLLLTQIVLWPCP